MIDPAYLFMLFYDYPKKNIRIGKFKYRIMCYEDNDRIMELQYREVGLFKPWLFVQSDSYENLILTLKLAAKDYMIKTYYEPKKRKLKHKLIPSSIEPNNQ